MKQYRAPIWLPGGNLQTIWPALWSRRVAGPPIAYRRERWTAPDGDFVDADWLDDAAAPPNGLGLAHVDAPASASGPACAPLLVLFHGLEGSSRSASSEAFAGVARARGWKFVVPHFRGCSGEINRAPRAYHSGDSAEVGWILGRLRERHLGPLLAVGVSLGGNALMRWAAEAGEAASSVASGIAAVCSPLDLAAGSKAIGRGFNRWVYTTFFLRTMKPKALSKLAQYPGLFDRELLAAARDLYDFDDLFTAPLHGFRSADDYYARASARPHLHRIRIPALALHARNDPFIPIHSLPVAGQVGPCVTLWQPIAGGHVGFPRGAPPGDVQVMPELVTDWLAQQATVSGASTNFPASEIESLERSN